MLFGDGAAALVVGPASRGGEPDIDVVQTYAGGTFGEVNAVIWPNPEFDHNLTVYGPEVKSFVTRYLAQMMGELSGLPDPAGAAASMLETIDLIMPHQANKVMVLQAAQNAGITADRLYFNVERVGNTSAASIPLAIRDAVADGVITRPVRVFTPAFGAGATAGYVVMRVDPSIVSTSPVPISASQAAALVRAGSPTPAPATDPRTRPHRDRHLHQPGRHLPAAHRAHQGPARHPHQARHRLAPTDLPAHRVDAPEETTIYAVGRG
jgi:3-oxoacyl-[acyl-carrier-protein] synthase-3